MHSPSWLLELLYSQWKKISASREQFVIFWMVLLLCPQWLQRKLRLPEQDTLDVWEFSTHLADCQHSLFIPAQFFAPYISQIILLLFFFFFFQNKLSKFQIFLNKKEGTWFQYHWPTATCAEACLLHLRQAGSCPLWWGSFLKAFRFISEGWGRKLISFTIRILNPALCPLNSC